MIATSSPLTPIMMVPPPGVMATVSGWFTL